MPATLTTVDAILKEVYGPRIVDQLQNETIALKRIERTSDGVITTVGGKYVDFPIRVQRNTGIGSRNENEQLPNAGQQGYAEVHVTLRYAYGRVRFTKQLMSLANEKHQAFASAMDREMEGLKSDIAKDENRKVYGDGTGLLASVTSTTVGNATQTVDNAQYLEVGMDIDILTRSNGAVTVADTKITAIAGNSVTVEDAYTGAATLGFYRTGSYNRERKGFAAIVNDTTVLFGVDPAVQPKWKSTVKANGGVNRALSEGLMIEGMDDVRKNGGKVSAIFTSLGVRRAYFNLLTQQRRYTDTKQFAGGFTGLAFNYGTEIPVVEDPDAPPNKMWGLDEDKFKMYRDKPWHWADEDGNVLKWVNNYDAFEAYMREFHELGTEQRNAHVLISDITEG